MIKKLKSRIMIKFIESISLKKVIFFLDNKLVKKPFVFKNEKINYIFHSHNNKGLTERTAELAIAKFYLSTFKPKNLLEIGNVTYYYYNEFIGTYQKKTVVDLGENDSVVIKEDIAKFKPSNKFDFILSVSTFEHMDEEDFRPLNFDYSNNTVAAKNIIYCYENLLEEGGCMLLTAALGWTKEWDRTFKSDILNQYPFKRIEKYLLKKINEQEWIQLDKIDIDYTPYGTPYPYGNWLSIIEIQK